MFLEDKSYFSSYPDLDMRNTSGNKIYYYPTYYIKSN